MSDVPPLTDVRGSMFHFSTPSPFGWDDEFRERHAAVSVEYNELIADAREDRCYEKNGTGSEKEGLLRIHYIIMTIMDIF